MGKIKYDPKWVEEQEEKERIMQEAMANAEMVVKLLKEAEKIDKKVGKRIVHDPFNSSNAFYAAQATKRRIKQIKKGK